jgi:hypothetical protein
VNEKPLLEALTNMTPTPRCSVGRLISDSSEELGIAIDDAVRDRTLPLRQVEKTLAENDRPVSVTMIRKHRLGLCSCRHLAPVSSP